MRELLFLSGSPHLTNIQSRRTILGDKKKKTKGNGEGAKARRERRIKEARVPVASRKR
jgi:hypothetical protein